MPKKTMTFEDAMLRLREVTETLEKGDVCGHHVQCGSSLCLS